MPMMRLKSSIMLCLSGLLMACSSVKAPHGMIPEQGMTMSELYHKEHPVKVSKLQTGTMQLTPTHPEFKVMNNPEVPITVFAHVASIGGEQIIKPSYQTRFFLYKQNAYVLNSELEQS